MSELPPEGYPEGSRRVWGLTVRLVRVLWRYYGVEESTWDREDMMRTTYPFLFRDKGTWFSRLRFK